MQSRWQWQVAMLVPYVALAVLKPARALALAGEGEGLGG